MLLATATSMHRTTDRSHHHHHHHHHHHYHIIIAEFIVRLLQITGALQKSKMCGKTLGNIVNIYQKQRQTTEISTVFSNSDRISYGVDVVRQCVPCGRTSMGTRTIARTSCTVVVVSSPSVRWTMNGVQNVICWC